MLETDRLVLRQWKESDYPYFINMGLDQIVMEYFPTLWTKDESLKFIYKVKGIIEKNGWGFWAVALKESGQFIGFIGLHSQPEQFEFSPCVEIGWRLAKEYWGNGYATEGSKAVLRYAFNELNLNKVVSFTTILNTRSEAIMKKIGMIKVKEFDHPRLPEGNYLTKHLLYEILNPDLI